MPKSQQVLLALTLILFICSIIIPIIGSSFDIDILSFSSVLVKLVQAAFIIIFTIFTYRQIKRKGF